MAIFRTILDKKIHKRKKARFRNLHVKLALLRTCVIGCLPFFVSTAFSETIREKRIAETQIETRSLLEDPSRLSRNYIDRLMVLESEELIYSASKQLEALRTAPSAASIISSHQIKSLAGLHIPQLLRLFPGIDVIQLSRDEFTVGLRGFVNRQFFRTRDLLVLVDNRTIYDDFSGNIEWETLDLFPQDIAKIEIIRGANSAIHGANGSRGLIHILTRPPISVPRFETDATFLKDGFRQRFAGSYYEEAYSFKISGGYDDIDVFNRFNNVTINGPRRTQVWRFNTALNRPLANGAELIFSGGTNTGRRLQNTTSGNLVENQQSNSHFQLGYEHPELSIRSFWNYRDLETTGPESQRVLTTRTQNMLDFEVIKRFHEIGKNSLTLGIQHRRTQANSFSTAGKVAQRTTGVFIDDKYNLSKALLFQTTLRLDRRQGSDTLFSPRLGISYQVSPKHTLKSSITVGYNNPTVSNNFFDFSIFGPIRLLGNPDLKPEKSIWYEIGYIARPTKKVKAGIDLFQVEMNNIIQPEGFPIITFVNNPKKITGYGGEFWGQYTLSQHLQIISNYNLSYYEQDSKKLKGTFPHKFNFGLLLSDLNKFTGALTYHYVYSTTVPYFIGGDDGAVSKTNKYNTLNFIIGYQLTKSAKIRLDALNVTNDKHRELPAIGEILGAEFRASLTLTY